MIVKFELEGKAYQLYFGMVSTRIFAELSAKEYLLLQDSGVETPTAADFDHVKLLAIMVHSGLCNAADINFDQRPKFIESYALSEKIANNEDVLTNINDTWSNSRPVTEMLEKLNSVGEEKKSLKKATGKKSKPTHSGS